ncbi:MAG: nickel-dependent lactate racemase [Bacilli bacterium]|nr:nickel-dependent lactate racemase [Acholeplasmataceae bacterium]MDY2902553.1 nickel-dependent lactate racemase [Bacilli bacterium]
MKTIKLPFYKGHIDLNIEEEKIAGVLVSKTESYKVDKTEQELVRDALENPINSLSLSVLCKDKKHVVVISSDHTRPVPSHITMPIILEEIRKYNKDVKITILIATGMHRPTTHEELVNKYGEKIVTEEEIVIHNAYDDKEMTFKGILPSGGELWVNKLVDECDFLMSEGFIEPHFFAGFSGGRKSVLPGIASKKTVLWNHNARFIASKYSRAGNLKDNPIHRDMLFAAKQVNLQFILNVVINGEKKIIKAFAGDLEDAHAHGCNLVKEIAQVEPIHSDIVITTNGGYPLDQNIYQTVKGMTAGEACVNEGGVIIICSSCADGTGGDFFYHLLADSKDAHDAYQKLNDVAPENTEFDQWEAQILARILCKATVIIVTDKCDPKIITDMHIKHAYTIDEALEKAYNIVGKDKLVTVIPDGISVIFK